MKIKHVTTYICDVCGAEFASESEGREHEAACYGLTPNEYGIWYLLNFRLENASRKADVCNTPETREILQTATPSEALARAEYKKCGRNYLLRYEKQPDGMRTSWWDDDLNCWRE